MLLQTFEGDYRTIEKGSLVREAIKVLNMLEIEKKQC